MVNKQVCIYKIINKNKGKFYIGSTNNFIRRKREHYYQLEKQKHCNKHLQRSFDTYGKDVFEFEVLFNLHPYLLPCLHTIEQKFIDTLEPEYNQQKIVGQYSGYICSEQTKDIISNASRNRECKPETRALLSTKMKIISNRPENKLRVSKEKTGVVLSETCKKKISSALMGNTNWTYRNKTTMSNHQKEIIIKAKAKNWIITYPDGQKESIFNLAQFCKDNNLNPANMRSTSCGKRQHHKGYKIEAL